MIKNNLKSLEQEVKKFYNTNQFPGKYALEDLLRYETPITNIYLNLIDRNIIPNSNILDAGCGTGLISNLLAIRHPTCNITGIDFSAAINYGKNFSIHHNISNVNFFQSNILSIDSKKEYDVIVCQGVLHHIPEYMLALTKLHLALKPGGRILLGLYHPVGKLLKKVFSLKYNSKVLYIDQEKNPYELSFTKNKVLEMHKGFRLIDAQPQRFGSIALAALEHSTNGGLITYVLEK